MDAKERENQINVTSNSQRNVGSFGVSNNNQKEKDVIRQRIDNTKTQNLRQNNANPSDISSPSSSNTLPKKDEGLSEEKKEINKNKDGLKEKPKAKDVLKNTGKRLGNNAVNKVANSDNDLARVTGKTVKAGQTAVRTVKTGAKAVKGIGTAIKAIAAFFSTPVGWATAIVLGVFLAILFIVIIIDTVLSSLAMRFGVSKDQAYEMYNASYEEGMSTSKIDDIFNDSVYDCNTNFLVNIKTALVGEDFSNAQELCLFMKRTISSYESSYGISKFLPGYVYSTLYYAYDSQNLDENGSPFIKFDDEAGAENDLDAITLLMIHKVFDLDYNTVANFTVGDAATRVGLENFTSIAGGVFTGQLFNQVINTINNASEKLIINDLLQANILHTNYTYYTYTSVEQNSSYSASEEEKESNNSDVRYECQAQSIDRYEQNDTKLKLFLRYGAKVANQYEKDLNANKAYDYTSDNCKNKVSDKVDVGKYDNAVNLDDDYTSDPKINIDGVDYGYNDGFIFTFYPKYQPRYTITKENPYPYTSSVAQEIELLINDIESRQDYINYVLGYPNSVLADADGINRECKYSANGLDVSDLKIRFIYGPSNPSIPGVNEEDVIPGYDLIDFDRYILGVVYGEIGSEAYAEQPELIKTYAVAARSFILGGIESGLFKIKEENGEQILEIANSTYRQTYCDPDKGCYQCVGGANNSIVTLLPIDHELPEGATCSIRTSKPIDDRIRVAVAEVEGEFLLDSTGSYFLATYDENTFNTWSNETGTYRNKLKATYSDTTIANAVCTFSATGDWAKWRQDDPQWGSIVIGSSNGKTVGQIGCFMTSAAMIIAKSSPHINIESFNPGTFAEAIKSSGYFDSTGGLYLNNSINMAVSPTKVIISGTSLSSDTAFSLKAQEVSRWINDGYDVMLRVKSETSQLLYGTSPEHWVVVTGVDNGQIYMADPATDYTNVLDVYYNEGVVYIEAIKFEE